MWTSLINVVLGAWLIFAPEIFHFGGASYINSRIAGPIVMLVSALAIRSVTRPARYLAILPALWLLATPIAFRYTQLAPIVDNVVIGLAIIALALIPTARRTATGGGWRALLTRSIALAEAKRAAHQAPGSPTFAADPTTRVIRASDAPTPTTPGKRLGAIVAVMAAVALGAALLGRAERPDRPSAS